MPKSALKYGDKRDFPKIDLYRITRLNTWEYLGSTTWSRTQREAMDRYAASFGIDRKLMRARFDKRA